MVSFMSFTNEQQRLYESLYRRIDDRFDVINPDLARLVLATIENRGELSRSIREKFPRVQEVVFNELQRAYLEADFP